MFYKMCNSPVTFQDMMNEIFKEEIAKGWLEIYMDNLLIHSPDLKMHRERTH
jgi:hypothetical protein